MPSNEKVNCKQHDKAGRRVSGPVSDLAFRDVSISLLAHCVQLSPPLSVVKDTRPIRAYRISWVEATLGRWYNKDEKEEYWGVRHIQLETMLSLVKWGKKIKTVTLSYFERVYAFLCVRRGNSEEACVHTVDAHSTCTFKFFKCMFLLCATAPFCLPVCVFIYFIFCSNLNVHHFRPTHWHHSMSF